MKYCMAENGAFFTMVCASRHQDGLYARMYWDEVVVVVVDICSDNKGAIVVVVVLDSRRSVCVAQETHGTGRRVDRSTGLTPNFKLLTSN